MHPFVLMLSVAHADLIVPPPPDTRHIVHQLQLDNVADFPDRVFLAIDADDTVHAHRVFTAQAPTQELGRGGRSRGGGLSKPQIRSLSQAEYKAWAEATGAAIRQQRAACADRGEGCVHISRFTPRIGAGSGPDQPHRRPGGVGGGPGPD